MMCVWNKYVLYIVDEWFFEWLLVNIVKVFEIVDVKRKYDFCIKWIWREVFKNYILILVDIS